MTYIKLLENKAITVLWLGQLLSAVGDQIYLISACWLAAQVSPNALAIVAASEYLSAFIFSFIAGVLTDRFNKIQLMIFADLGRAVAVFTLPIASFYHSISIAHLALVGTILGILGVLFDPCLVGTIPVLAQEEELLQATNGLIDFTKRLARALGPALAGILAIFVPIQLLLGLNGLSFLISAAAIIYIRPIIGLTQSVNVSNREFFGKELLTAAKLVKANALILWELVFYFFANVAWAIVYTAGLPLLTRSKFGDNITAYGLLVSVYGIASIIANLLVGHKKIRYEARAIFYAYMGWGIGFTILALSPHIVLAAIGLILAALAGPVISITIVTMMQRQFPIKDIGKVYSFRTAAMFSGLGLGLCFSAYLFGNWNITLVICCAASIYLVMGISGILRFSKKEGF